MPRRIRDEFHPYAGREHERVLWEDRRRLSFGNLVVDLAAYRVTVVLPEFITRSRWHRLLHNQLANRLRRVLMARPNTVVVDVPYHLMH